MLNELLLSSLRLGSRKDTLTGHDNTKTFFVKIQVAKHPGKRNSLKEEFEILEHLNREGCQTCPEVISFETISKENLIELVKEEDREYIKSLEKDLFDVMIQKYVETFEENYSLSDVLLSAIEQKMLGVYQGDIKPDNIRFDSSKSICIFVDYDQALHLDDNQKNLSNDDFFDFCNRYDKEKYGFGNWLRHFPQFDERDYKLSLTNGLLDLSKTTILNKQITTNSSSGIYHSINGPFVYALGSRTLDDRSVVLNEVDFFEGEKVLDVGCNMGLLSTYLHKRGCNVTGIDNDPRIVVLAKIVSNILSDKIDYEHIDLDEADSLNSFDTIFLFSVFHHTKNPIENAKKITSSCNRIIIETRLIENGKQPINGVWTPTTRWSLETKEQLAVFLEKLFEGFRFARNIGEVDKGRYIIELVKDV